MDFLNSTGIRSPFSPRVRQQTSDNYPRRNPLNKSHLGGDGRGEVVYKSPQMAIETLGTPLPVAVTEALAFSAGGVSVRMGVEVGWWWCVAGRRVLCMGGAGEGVRELALPHAGLPHTAQLVMLNGDKRVPCAVGVAPEGYVRYWPSVAQENAFVETTCDLQGQECLRLWASGDRWLLVTTSGALLSLTRTGRSGREALEATVLRPAGGRRPGLAELGRRVSQLFFQSAQTLETRLVGVAALSGGLVALVSRGAGLQLWREGGDFREHDLRRSLPADLADLECVDVKESGDDTFVLLMCATTADFNIRYALAEVSVRDRDAPAVLSLRTGLSAPAEAVRVLPMSTGGSALIYAPTYLLMLQGASDDHKVDSLDVGDDDDRILGAEVVDGEVLLFSAKHGVARLVVNTRRGHVRDAPIAETRVADTYDGNLSFYEIDPREVDPLTTDARGKLKIAFLYHVRGDAAATARVLDEVFGAEHERRLFADTGLAVAKEILDDAPAGDPRWRTPRTSGGPNIRLGSSAALHLVHQLADKTRASALLHDFLVAKAHRYADEAGRGAIEREMRAMAEMMAAAMALADMRKMDVVDMAVGDGGLGEVSGIGGVLRRLPLVGRCAEVMAVVADVVNAMKRVANGSLHEVKQPTEADRPLREAIRHIYDEFFSVCVSRVDNESTLMACLRDAQIICEYLLLNATDARQQDELIRPFECCGERSVAVTLCERVRRFDNIVRMCVMADDYDTLYAYIDKYPEERLARSAFSLLCSLRGAAWCKLVTHVGPRYPHELKEWLNVTRTPNTLAAIAALQAANWTNAAYNLASAAYNERQEGNVDRLATTAALGKLCALAAETPDEHILHALTSSEALCRAHRTMPTALKEVAMQRVHTAQELITLYLNATHLNIMEYLSAFQLTREICDADVRDEMTLQLWCKAIVQDDWRDCNINEMDTEVANKVFFNIIEDMRYIGGADKYLPPLDDVLTSPCLADALDDNSRYVITYGYKMATGEEY